MNFALNGGWGQKACKFGDVIYDWLLSHLCVAAHLDEGREDCCEDCAEPGLESPFNYIVLSYAKINISVRSRINY